jgi:DNA repair protein SbcC/Rad50
MRPIRLVLDGFGTYRHQTEIDFTDVEFFALVGPTGSGKSTVIDALCFALYGTIPRWDNEREIRNALAPSANACDVSLIFELAGERYVAARSLQRDKRGQVTTKAARLERLDAGIPPDAPLAELLEASVESLADRPDEVKSRVAELLGLSYEHFTQSVLLPQGGFSEFLRAKPADRQRLLIELLAFGVYKEIGQRARVRADRAADLRKHAERARDQLTEATPEAEIAAKTRLDALTTLAETVDTSLAALADLDQQAAAARKIASDAGNDVLLLAAVRTPAAVPGLAQQIAAADTLVAGAKARRDESERLASVAAEIRSGLPDQAETLKHLRNHELRRELIEDAARQQEALDAARAAQEHLALKAGAAEQAASVAQDALAAAQRAHQAADLAQHLHPGDTCPVCEQKIPSLPARAVPANLKAAQSAAESAAKAHRQASEAHHKAAMAVVAAQSKLDEIRGRLDKAAQVMAGVPAEEDLHHQLNAISNADAIMASARAEATARITELTAAEESRKALVTAEQEAWAELSAARDKLVVLGAPAIAHAGSTGSDLAAAWATLVTWAQEQLAERTQRLPGLSETAAKLQQQFADGVAALAGLLAEHGIEDVDPIARIPAAVADQRARAEARLSRVREDRRQAKRLDKEIGARKEEEHVAAMLGNHLRANNFENWLCTEALDSLVTEASATLMELSGGQYELDRDDRNDLVVIDYADAGSRRPVHTLSGGETFQASLALALALSRQVIGLSAGMRELNSMFLDEGFGTLDSDTLEVVASTLERLAADSDRMVGVITHVSELAERAPVRFVVSRTGTTSTIVRDSVAKDPGAKDPGAKDWA